MQCLSRVSIRRAFDLALPFTFARQRSGFDPPVIDDIPLVWKSRAIAHSN
jgi:hypothetical protein